LQWNSKRKGIETQYKSCCMLPVVIINIAYSAFVPVKVEIGQKFTEMARNGSP
jgi:hypothetical protein